MQTDYTELTTALTDLENAIRQAAVESASREPATDDALITELVN